MEITGTIILIQIIMIVCFVLFRKEVTRNFDILKENKRLLRENLDFMRHLEDTIRYRLSHGNSYNRHIGHLDEVERMKQIQMHMNSMANMGPTTAEVARTLELNTGPSSEEVIQHLMSSNKLVVKVPKLEIGDEDHNKYRHLNQDN